MKYYSLLISLFFPLFTLTMMGCQTDDDLLDNFIEPVETNLWEDSQVFHDQPDNEGVANALAKARLVAEIEWIPLAPVPSVYGKKYPAGEHRKGIPYSLAQKVNGYVGLDVSFYTFLTAIHNPYSVIYTENLAAYPYFGFDCAPYYGSVCATSVWYVLGIKAPYYTSSIQNIPQLKKRDDIDASSISLCDVLWCKGHVAMVYDIARDVDSCICKVTVFETTRADHSDSRLIEYSLEVFKERWNRVNWVVYRPKDLSNNKFDEADFFNVGSTDIIPFFVYNSDICTSRGDRVAYASGEDVTIDILSNGYKKLELYCDDQLYEVRTITGKEETYCNLPYGLYKARLVGQDKSSEYTCFEVIDINVSYSVTNNVTVYFSSRNGTPEFMSLGDERECPYYCTVFSKSQIENGSVTVSKSSPYLKVHFRGKYGRVSNKLIKIEQ